MNSLKKKRRFKMPHVYVLLLSILFFVGILSLIFSWIGVETTVKGELKTIKGSGILDWFTILPLGFASALWVIVFILVIGGFINVLIKTRALEAVMSKIASKFTSNIEEIPLKLKVEKPFLYFWKIIKEWFKQTWLLIPLIWFFSFGGMSYGMSEETLAFYVILVPFLIAAGFDVWTALLVIYVSSKVGIMGSVVNPFTIGTAVDSSKIKEVTMGTGLIWRVISWLILTIALTLLTTIYAFNVKRNKNKSKVKDLFEIHKKTFVVLDENEIPKLTKRRLITAVIFLMSFIFMIIAMLQWDSLLENKPYTGTFNKIDKTIFGNNKSTSWLHNSSITGHSGNSSYLKEKGGSSYETAWTFGGWYIGTLVAYFFIISLIIAFINKVPNFIKTMIDGSKSLLGVAFAVAIARTIPVLLEKTHLKEFFATQIANSLQNIKIGKALFVPILTYILFIPLVFVIPSQSGLASATFGVIGEGFKTVNDTYLLSGTITSYSFACGLGQIIVPTSGVLIGTLAITKIPYEKYLKNIIKLLFILFILGFLMIVLGGLISTLQGKGQKIF